MSTRDQKTSSQQASSSLLYDFFSIDLRSLAFFRIAMGIILLVDLYYRSLDLSLFYSDDGFLPRQEAIRRAEPWAFSLFFVNGTWVYQGILFIIGGIAQICLLLGYRTRLAAIVSWIFILSLHRRNNQIIQGGDDLIRVLSFWMMFLPLAKAWSIESLGKAIPTRRHLSIASIAVLIQMCLVYIFTSILKSGDAWRLDGTAIELALNLDQFTKPFGYFLLNYPHLLQAMTFAVFSFEMYGPFFAFFPAWNPLFRTVTAFSFIGFHLGLFLAMELGPFPFVCMAGWTLFLPPEFWNLLTRSTLFRQAAKGAGVFGSKIQQLLPKTLKTEEESSEGVAHFSIRKIKRRYLLRELILAFYLVNVFCWNVRTTDFTRWMKYYPRRLNFILQSVGLDQHWSMFSPYPLTDDGWYLIVGTTAKRTINLTPGSQPDDPISDDKPNPVADMYKTERWRKYLMNMMMVKNQEWRRFFVLGTAKKWNREHPEELIKTIDIYFWMERTNLRAPQPPTKEHLWHYDVSLP